MPEPIRWQDAWWYQQPDGTWLRFNDATQQWDPVPAQPQPAYAPAGGMSTGAKVAIGAAIALVAFLVIAILAAIAIPVFLQQREKGWTAQAEAALKNAAVAQEMHYTDASEYATTVDDLYAEGLKTAESVNLVIVRADHQQYCIEARHEMLPSDIWSYDSEVGRPQEGPCF